MATLCTGATFEAHQTMQQFMWQANLLQAAKFSDAGMKKLQTVDPNEGSNIQPARLAGMMSSPCLVRCCPALSLPHLCRALGRSVMLQAHHCRSPDVGFCNAMLSPLC